METTIENKVWGIRSVSYWMVALVALGIIFVGIRFIITPQVGAVGYGIPFRDLADDSFGKIKGIRDIYSGLQFAPLLLLRMRKATAWIFTMTIIIPLFDFCMILTHNGAQDIAHLLIHGLTAVYMIITSVLLFRNI